MLSFLFLFKQHDSLFSFVFIGKNKKAINKNIRQKPSFAGCFNRMIVAFYFTNLSVFVSLSVTSCIK